MQQLKCVMLLVIFLITLIFLSEGRLKAGGNQLKAENHLACKFQTGLCNWKQAEDDIFNWTRRIGETPSSDTGPSTGYGGTGYYIYIETSSPRVSGDNAKLVFENFTGSVCLRFYRHMYGAHIGSLRIKVNGVTKLTRAGNYGNEWIADAVDINGTNVKIEVEGERASGYTGDIALDNFEETSAGCNPVQENTEGWTLFNSKYYKVFNETALKQKDAQKRCEEFNGTLVQLFSDEIVEVVLKQVKTAILGTDEVWIGLTRRDDGRFYWQNGSFWSQFYRSYSEKTAGNEDCVYILPSNLGGQWNDNRCQFAYNLRYVCENASASSCPGGWQQFRSSCYLDSQSSTNKHAAEQNCRKYRSELVTIDSAAENTFIAGLGLKDTPPRTDAILIGLQWTSGGHFRWNDGTSWENSLFKNWPWKPGEPNNGIGNGKSKCATLFIKGSSEGKVVDRNCLESFLFVCEKTAEISGLTYHDNCENVSCGPSQHCVNTTVSYYCACAKGYTRNPENDTECQEVTHHDNCENISCGQFQHCVNTTVSYDCACAKGYTRNPDNATECEAKSPEASQLSKSAILGISISCSVVLLICIVCVLYGVKLSRQKHRKEVEKVGDGGAIFMANIASKDPWELLEGQLSMLDAIGEGAFGEVFKGTMRLLDSQAENSTSSKLTGNQTQRETTVAVKKLRALAGDDQKQQFMEEIEMMKKLGQHKNIVNMVACCTNKEPFLLVVEYVPNGDLLNYLRKIRLQISSSYCNNPVYSEGGIIDKERRLTEEQRDGFNVLELDNLLSVSWQISCGMEYLATKGFVHRDLAARNVLLGDNKVVKVADFGLSRRLYENAYHTKNSKKLPMKWMPPESIFYQTFTRKSDVWAFGVVMWEITTLGGTPYPGLRGNDLVKALKRGYRMEKPDICSDEIYAIMNSCWSESPDDRPSFTQLRKQLERMMERNTPYLDISKLEDEAHTYYNDIPAIGSNSSSSVSSTLETSF